MERRSEGLRSYEPRPFALHPGPSFPPSVHRVDVLQKVVWKGSSEVGCAVTACNLANFDPKFWPVNFYVVRSLPPHTQSNLKMARRSANTRSRGTSLERSGRTSSEALGESIRRPEGGGSLTGSLKSESLGFLEAAAGSAGVRWARLSVPRRAARNKASRESRRAAVTRCVAGQI